MSEHQRPIVTVDVVILTLEGEELKVLLTERDKGPFEGRLALPGGYVHTDEDADTESAARRVLKQKVDAGGFHMEQLQTFSGSARDPRGYSISVSYLALVPPSHLPKGALLMPVEEASGLAFDHDRIVQAGVDRLRRKAAYSTAPASLLEKPFTIPELHAAYEVILNSQIDIASFRRKMLDLSALEETPEGKGGGQGKGRKARTYVVPEVETFDRNFGGMDF